MTVTDLFTVRTYAEEVYTRVAVGPLPGDPPLGVLPGAVLTAWLVVAGLVLAAKLVGRDRPITTGRPMVVPLGGWRIPITLAVALSLFLVVGVPLVSLGYKAGIVVTQVGTDRVRTWSFWQCLQMVAGSPWRYRWEFGWSLWISTLAATASAAAATVLAWIARRGGLAALGVFVTIAVCLAISGPLLGLAVIRLLNQPNVPMLFCLYDSIFAPWLTLWIRGLPPATLIMWHALRSIPPEMLDCAAVDGAGPLARLWRVALPCRLWALALAWVVSLAVALGDLAASILVLPPGVDTLSRHIFGLLHYGVEDRVAGICLALIAVFALVAAGVVCLAKKWPTDRADM
jgi:iron(III) transport system permease protein